MAAANRRKRPRDGAKDGRHHLAGLQQAIELCEGFGRVSGDGRLDDFPGSFRPPSATHFADQFVGDLAVDAGVERQLGDLLIQQAEFRPDDLDQQGGRVLRQVYGVAILCPSDEPLEQLRLIHGFLASLVDLRCAALNLDRQLVDQLVEPRIRGPLCHVEHQDAALLRVFDVHFESSPMLLHEVVRVLHDRQPQSRRIEERHRTQFIVHVTPRHGSSVKAGHQRLVIGPHLLLNAPHGQLLEEWIVTEQHFDRRGGRRLGQELEDVQRMAHGGAVTVPRKDEATSRLGTCRQESVSNDLAPGIVSGEGASRNRAGLRARRVMNGAVVGTLRDRGRAAAECCECAP